MKGVIQGGPGNVTGPLGPAARLQRDGRVGSLARLQGLLPVVGSWVGLYPCPQRPFHIKGMMACLNQSIDLRTKGLHFLKPSGQCLAQCCAIIFHGN